MGNNLFHGSIEYKYGDNKIILRKNEYRKLSKQIKQFNSIVIEKMTAAIQNEVKKICEGHIEDPQQISARHKVLSQKFIAIKESFSKNNIKELTYEKMEIVLNEAKMIEESKELFQLILKPKQFVSYVKDLGEMRKEFEDYLQNQHISEKVLERLKILKQKSSEARLGEVFQEEFKQMSQSWISGYSRISKREFNKTKDLLWHFLRISENENLQHIKELAKAQNNEEEFLNYTKQLQIIIENTHPLPQPPAQQNDKKLSKQERKKQKQLNGSILEKNSRAYLNLEEESPKSFESEKENDIQGTKSNLIQKTVSEDEIMNHLKKKQFLRRQDSLKITDMTFAKQKSEKRPEILLSDRPQVQTIYFSPQTHPSFKQNPFSTVKEDEETSLCMEEHPYSGKEIVAMSSAKRIETANSNSHFNKNQALISSFSKMIRDLDSKLPKNQEIFSLANISPIQNRKISRNHSETQHMQSTFSKLFMEEEMRRQEELSMNNSKPTEISVNNLTARSVRKEFEYFNNHLQNKGINNSNKDVHNRSLSKGRVVGMNNSEEKENSKHKLLQLQQCGKEMSNSRVIFSSKDQHPLIQQKLNFSQIFKETEIEQSSSSLRNTFIDGTSKQNRAKKQCLEQQQQQQLNQLLIHLKKQRQKQQLKCYSASHILENFIMQDQQVEGAQENFQKVSAFGEGQFPIDANCAVLQGSEKQKKEGENGKTNNMRVNSFLKQGNDNFLKPISIPHHFDGDQDVPNSGNNSFNHTPTLNEQIDLKLQAPPVILPAKPRAKIFQNQIGSNNKNATSSMIKNAHQQ